MWPFDKPRPKDKRDKARNDITSLGNLLLRSGMVSAEELHDALEFQDDNPDVMLGEALVKMGVVERVVVDALLVTQKAKRGNHKNAADVVRLATEHVRSSNACHGEVREAAMRLNGVVKAKG